MRRIELMYIGKEGSSGWGGSESEHTPNDGVLIPKERGTLPFLVFEDGVIDALTVHEETVNNDDVSIELYDRTTDDDGEDVDREITAMCNIKTTIAGLHSLYFAETSTGLGYLTTVPPVQTLNVNYLSSRGMEISTLLYPLNFVEDSVSEVFVSRPFMNAALPKPDDNFGDSITIKTISIGGLGLKAIPNRRKLDITDGSVYIGDGLLSLIEIDTSTFDAWDPNTLPLYSLLQLSSNVFKPVYVGGQDVDKFYIPLQ